MQFSIIIPAKNEESNIRYCLDAVRELDFSKDNYEVIVIDNGSTDGTVSIVNDHGCSVYVKPQLSLSGLRNFGASVALGNIFVFLDADCVPDKDWLKNIAITLGESEVGCTGSTPVASVNGTWVEKVWSSFRTRRKNKYYTQWINSSNFIVRRELFVKVGGFNEKVSTGEDVDICFRLNKICKILFEPAIKVVHLGEPKTIREFFFKEIWRGKGLISGLISHGVRLSEIRSIAIPLYYLSISICLIAVTALSNFKIFLIMALLYIAPAVIFTAWVITKTKQIRNMFGYLVLFLVYVNARVMALFLRRK
jgi:glycosyltransferase involved in cell wall biosynthesis